MGAMTIERALLVRRSCRSFDGRAIELDLLRRLLWAAQGITDDTEKRTAPSAHALHPLNLVLVTGNVKELEPGLYSVDPARMELALIAVCADFRTPMKAFADQPPAGERGARYVYIEAGAAAQNVQLLAAAEGLGCVLVAGFDDGSTTKVLKLRPPIEPVLYLCIGWPGDG